MIKMEDTEKEQLRKELICYLDKIGKPAGQRKIEMVINAVFDGTVKELFYDEEEDKKWLK